MQNHFIYFLLAFVSLLASSGSVYAASSDLEVAGWVPYWSDTQGIRDVKKHLTQIDTVFPFAFTVTTKGELRDQAGLDKSDWRSLARTAHKKRVEMIPTVMWSDGASTHAVLSNTTARATHIEEIVTMVDEGNFDGVDIDYEGKKSETINYFSLFLKELKEQLGKKVLSCTIEARTPPESLYKEVPTVINYANDYKEIAKHCDRVQIMAYDQQRADLLLNKSKQGAPYMPVADVDWVEKVLKFTLTDIPKEKIVLGMATYGHHYAVTVAPDWYRDYWKLGALNVPSILEIAEENDVTPTRNKAGEMSFSYIPDSSVLASYTKTLKIPKDTPKGDIAAARALAYANKTGKEATFNIAWYSDAGAMKDKIDLAKKYKIKGVALFKFDRQEDQDVWKYLR